MIEFMSIEEVAQKLGIKKMTLHNWVSMRKIPYTKIGRKVIFDPDSIDAWLKKKEIKPHKCWD